MPHAASPLDARNPSPQDLATAYLPLARSLARPWRATWPNEADEFVGEALLALVRAAAAFDAGYGVSFARFARSVIANDLRSLHRRLKARHAREILTSDLDAGFAAN